MKLPLYTYRLQEMEKTRNITFITTVSLFFFSKSLCQVVVNVSYKFALSILHSRHRVDCLYCVSLLCHAIIRRDPAAERALCGDRHRAAGRAVCTQRDRYCYAIPRRIMRNPAAERGP